MKLREEHTCPLELTHDVIKGKWKPIILWQLGKGASSLAKLERDINGISQKMLLEQLKELLDFGVVEKQTSEGYPLKSSYFLSQRGKKLLEAVVIMQAVGIEMLEEDALRK